MRNNGAPPRKKKTNMVGKSSLIRNDDVKPSWLYNRAIYGVKSNGMFSSIQ